MEVTGSNRPTELQTAEP